MTNALCRCPARPPARVSTVLADRVRVGSRLSGYGPQAGSPFPPPWGPLKVMDHDAEQRGLETIRRRFALFGNSSSSGGGDPALVGAIRAVQTRVAQVAASQGGHLTPVQREQLRHTRRRIATVARFAGLGDYIAMDFPLPTPLDDGTNLSEVAANNFPIMTAPDPSISTPAPAASSPSLLGIAAIVAAGWYFFFRKK